MIQLLPKKKIGISKGQIILFYSSLFLLIISIIAYLIFVFLDKRTYQEIQETKGLVLQTKNPTEIKIEQRAKNYEKKLESFSFILNKHSYSSKIFPFLEKDTLTKVYFTSFNLNPISLRLDLDGVTDNFQILGQQILILRKDPLVKSVSLKNISIVSLGMVRFSLDISLWPKSIMIQK